MCQLSLLYYYEIPFVEFPFINVLSVDDSQVLIYIGEDQGVNIGDSFISVRVLDEIIHPKHWLKKTDY